MSLTIRPADPEDFDRFSADLNEWRGCREVVAVTAPAKTASAAFHQRLGFDLLPGPSTANRVPFSPAYDGPGDDRGRFRKLLQPHTAGQRVDLD